MKIGRAGHWFVGMTQVPTAERFDALRRAATALRTPPG